ncbi:hypothetical protein TNCV_2770021 [Trichonephila clavipes]|nr:hypothetical protein TNCV_2770021 [Trichonephila clavipes]
MAPRQRCEKSAVQIMARTTNEERKVRSGYLPFRTNGLTRPTNELSLLWPFPTVELADGHSSRIESCISLHRGVFVIEREGFYQKFLLGKGTASFTIPSAFITAVL